jgi:hypothetical protein
MEHLDTRSYTLENLNVQVTFDELCERIQTGTKRPDILATAEKTLHKVNNIWNPSIVYRWLKFGFRDSPAPQCCVYSGSGPVDFDLGHSALFLKGADIVLIAAYSAGREIEFEGANALKNEDLLVAYMLDLIGLLVLEKTGDIVIRIAEEKATEFAWGVSPFLSPGSIHGWELEEQLKLCSLLPLNDINMVIRDDAVLSPFKSLSCLIGIGKGFETDRVGTTCNVCSRNKNCEMQKLY